MKARVRKTCGGDWIAVLTEKYSDDRGEFEYERMGFDTKKTLVQAARAAAATLRKIAQQLDSIAEKEKRKGNEIK